MKNSDQNDYIKYIANLAKLSLNEDEMKSLADDMQDIIGLMDTIRDIDTENIDATEHICICSNEMQGQTSNFREDTPGTPLDTTKILSNSKHAMENCFPIPKMIE